MVSRGLSDVNTD